MEVKIERDAALRGYWLTGLQDIQEAAQTALVVEEAAIFISDKVLRQLAKVHGYVMEKHGVE